MKTYSQKPSEISRRWVLFDASELPLGRLATKIADHLTGKYKHLMNLSIDTIRPLIEHHGEDDVGLFRRFVHFANLLRINARRLFAKHMKPLPERCDR